LEISNLHTLKLTLFLIIVVSLAGMLAGCGGEASNASSSADGESLFNMSVIGSVAGCATCHSKETGTVIIGPSLAGIANLAAERVEGVSAEEYLRQSITQPDAFVVEGYPAGVMPAKYTEELSEEELDSLVAYLLTLK
jgi:mono/diheme cytochrome c family protein